MKAVAVTMLLGAAAVLLGAADKRLAAGQAENDTVRINATVLDAAHLRDAIGTDLGNQYVALEVTVTPKGSEPLVVSLNDFILRSQSSGEHPGALAASEVAGSGELVVSRTYGNRSGPGEPKLIEGTKIELKSDRPDEASKTLEEKLKEKILAETTTAQPITGLLIFPLKQEKPKNLALSYSGPKGKVRVEFK